MTAPRLEKLRHFIHEVDRLHREHHQTAPLLDAVAAAGGAGALRLTGCRKSTPAASAPLPAVSAACRLRERFSIVSFVWGPGQATPIRSPGVGAIGMLRGAEENQRYQLDADGIPRALGAATLLEAGGGESLR